MAVTAIGFVGCASDNADSDSHKRTTGRYIDDKMLVQRVKGSLNDNEVYKFPDVKVNTYNGTVQLTVKSASPLNVTLVTFRLVRILPLLSK